MPSIQLKMVKGFGNKQEEIDKAEFVLDRRLSQ